MTLTIKPPQLPTCDFQPQLNNIQQISTNIDPVREPSPGAPEYSPITPKTHPAIPAITGQTIEPQTTVDSSTQPQHNGEPRTTAIAPTETVPPPPSQPFSSDESIDGLALRAAISSLQFQRQQARDDIKSLQEIKKQALAEPERFTQELVAGKVKEKRHDFGSAQDVLDAEAGVAQTNGEGPLRSIPGPQNVVRMPHINWDKYNIMGEPLEALHEQQRRYPGSAPFQQNKGREYSVTAPYSPFDDVIEVQTHARKTSDGSRKDSAPNSVVSTPITGEHPYETRRSSKHQAQ